MTTWAATNSRIIPWTMPMMSTGISVARCIAPAPARMIPNSSAAPTTPNGCARPSRATAMPSKP